MSEGGDPQKSSLDTTTTCPVFRATGECKHGLKCRFLGNHFVSRDTGEMESVVDEDKKAHVAASETEVNFIDGDTLRKIRTKKVRTSFLLFLLCSDGVVVSTSCRRCVPARAQRPG